MLESSSNERAILHLIDATAAERVQTLLPALIGRLSLRGCEPVVGATDARATRRAALLDLPVQQFPVRMGIPALAAAAIRRCIRRKEISLIHAWGGEAAGVAQAAVDSAMPLLVTLPGSSGERTAKWRRLLAEGRKCVVVCESEPARQRLIEQGVAADGLVVIRPGVDFAAVDQARRRQVRAKIGLAGNALALLTLPPPTRAGGHYYAVWAGALLSRIHPHVRVIVPGESRELQRLRRFAASFGQPDLVLATGERYSLEELLAAADLCVVAGREDVDAAGLALAMASSVPIVASAIPAVTELLAHRHNCLLCRPSDPADLASCILRLLEDRELAACLADAARRQACQAFHLGRCVDRYLLEYERVLVGDRSASTAASG